mgnify:CR=1 FL=1
MNSHADTLEYRIYLLVLTEYIANEAQIRLYVFCRHTYYYLSLIILEKSYKY